MRFSLRDVVVAAALSLILIAGSYTAALAHEAPARTGELMQFPMAGMIVGALIIAANGAIGYGISRAANNRLATEVLHP